jgi:hypothetical protein
MGALRMSVQRHLIISTLILMAPFAAIAEPLTGTAALKLLAGRSFKLSCGDGLHGYGQFDRRGSAWAAFNYGSDSYSEPERRASAIVRAQGKEVCFTLRGLEIAGEICAPVKQKSSGIYRFGANDDWCDVQQISRLPQHIEAIVSR